jgi:[acyl-carrier-protein] S-malonyltransferase
MGLVILCPGQGAQHVQMFDLLRGEPAAAPVLDAAGDLLGADLRALPESTLAGHLFDNPIAQPLICAAAVGAWQALRSLLPPPLLFAGYSIGELAAHGCAGTLPAETVIRLARTRAQLMDACTAARGGMLAIKGLRQPVVEALCLGSGAEIAIHNAADHFVIGGPVAVLDVLAEAAIGRGARLARRLQVNVISHTTRLCSVSAAFAEALAAAPLDDPPVPVLAGMDGAPVRTRAGAINALSAQLSQSIRWRDCMEAALEMGGQVFLELGPGNTLTRMLQEMAPDVAARSLAEFRSVSGAAAWANRQLG